MYKWTYDTEIGLITIGADDQSIIYLKTVDACEGLAQVTPLIQKAYEQLVAYLAGERCHFDLPLNPKGTAFQKKVWLASSLVPYGETATYKQLAKSIDAPTAVRAVGAANGKNPIYILIPCHRMIASSGHLTGYGGGLEMKEKLLTLEGADPVWKS